MATPFQTYEQNGEKLSFANWISMISPEDTPFVSMTGKESINEIMFQWQVDRLAKVNPNNAYVEGTPASFGDMTPTTTKQGLTQILRKTVSVSDTANAISAYGRGRELQYQMEKAGREIKRDLEVILLSAQEKNDGSKYDPNKTPTADAGTPRLTDGFASPNLIATTADPDTGVSVRVTAGADFETSLFQLTANLYTVGADCDIIMIPPSLANTVAALQEVDGSRLRIFENSKQFVKQVNTITDPLGQTFKVIVNRWMPTDKIYIFRASDWTQMVLRAPKRIQLAKTGSAENWMIEMEVGLRHRNPYASGILDMASALQIQPNPVNVTVGGNTEATVSEAPKAAKAAK